MPEVVAPDALEDHRAGQHLLRIEQEELQQRELSARELDRVAATADFPRCRVELEVGEAEDGIAAFRGPAKQCAQTCKELLERERLDEVVVGARVQSRHSIC